MPGGRLPCVTKVVFVLVHPKVILSASPCIGDYYRRLRTPMDLARVIDLTLTTRVVYILPSVRNRMSGLQACQECTAFSAAYFSAFPRRTSVHPGRATQRSGLGLLMELFIFSPHYLSQKCHARMGPQEQTASGWAV
ncbi:hypothetical protein EDC04DRAFT_2673813, partial [Pisolithus marmoratus]